ncbi:MAG: HEAT repeat domain-containing protein [Anaerolineales bacterium]|nr:HEAT repeat domain-containing protein [Anaerolineales bacterium]
MSKKDLDTLISNLISDNEALAIAAVDEISAFGAAALPALFQLLESPNPNERWWAIRVLSAIPSRDVTCRLRESLGDPDYTIRQCAALGLSQQPDIGSIPDLIERLDDTDRLVARLAADALIAIGGPAVTDLIAVLEGGQQPAKVEAARALAVIGDTRAIPTMFAAREDGSALVRHWVEQGFERMGVGMQFFKPE